MNSTFFVIIIKFNTVFESNISAKTFNILRIHRSLSNFVKSRCTNPCLSLQKNVSSDRIFSVKFKGELRWMSSCELSADRVGISLSLQTLDRLCHSARKDAKLPHVSAKCVKFQNVSRFIDYSALPARL